MTRALVCALALVLTGGCQKRTGELVVTPRYVPHLKLESVGPVPTRVDALHGRVLLVNFMATWCIPCLQELPALVALQQRYAQRGFTVVLVGMDLEGALVLEPFADHYQLTFPMLVADQRIRKGESAFGEIRILPHTFLISRQGDLRAMFQGIASPSELEDLVRRELGPEG
ncbi:MAG: TlpA family protein disulfide reductase [Myxococcota bacterium]|nr:TlpA family protein disulfide reductase [Myxococcota bacterium]